MTSTVNEVSVVLPVRDAARTLAVALRSVLRSRGVRFDVVCVNHRSVDASPAILARFAQRDARVRIVDAPDAPRLADALEQGRAACGAPIIARMDADDVMHPDRLRADVDALRANPALGAVASRGRVVPKGKARPGLRAYVAWQNACLSVDDHAREIWIEQPLLQPATTYRASALDAVGGWRLDDGVAAAGEPEDYAQFLRMAVARIDIAKRADVHHSWRQHDATSTRFDRDVLARMKARAMVVRFALRDRDVVIAGAGKEGARIARALAVHGVRATAFLDVSAKRIGRVRHGVPVLDARTALASLRANTRTFVVAAIGTSGARGVVRAQLHEAGYVELTDCVVVA